ncbi:hypothetical protein AV530_009039 [Patagioenas fasciata monilis]|uniref:Uncharacterized protein n=1 Tax=Patagioenas fasciata monilis TaxID=372326 RepID=A0A1V4KQW7_PATFA|nr:hypothetical protein AV530_009039 [Patagioenas fasciata monilis]
MKQLRTASTAVDILTPLSSASTNWTQRSWAELEDEDWVCRRAPAIVPGKCNSAPELGPEHHGLADLRRQIPI